MLHAVAGLLLLTLAVVPQSGPKPPLISPAWLAEHLRDPDLVVLHVGTKGSYDAGHIPGARHGYLMDLHAWNALTLEMLPDDSLRQRLSALGISDRSRVVVYSTGALSVAARLYFLLDHAGVRNVLLLDGGLPAWTRAGKPVTSDTPTVQPGSLSPLKTRELVVDAAFVRSRLRQPGYAVVDARARSLYDGIEVGGNEREPHKVGHIAGAVSVPFNTVEANGDGLKPAEELRRIFTAAGVKPGDVVIGYCHVGQQVNSVLLAARLLGHKVLLYDGSFEDWSRRNLPVEPDARKRP